MNAGALHSQWVKVRIRVKVRSDRARRLFRGQKVKGQRHQPINAVTDNAPYAGRRNYNFLKISLFCLVIINSYY